MDTVNSLLTWAFDRRCPAGGHGEWPRIGAGRQLQWPVAPALVHRGLLPNRQPSPGLPIGGLGFASGASQLALVKKTVHSSPETAAAAEKVVGAALPNSGAGWGLEASELADELLRAPVGGSPQEVSSAEYCIGLGPLRCFLSELASTSLGCLQFRRAPAVLLVQLQFLDRTQSLEQRIALERA